MGFVVVVAVVVWMELDKPQNKHMEINAKRKLLCFNFLNLQKRCVS